jgi:hypothetical protein
MNRSSVGAAALVLSVLLSQPVFAQATGTLVFDSKPFTSEVDLKEKIEKQLKSGGLEWGVVGNQLVVTLVNKRFINGDIPNLTRYGERKEIQLPAGQYTLTCVGLIPEGGLSVDKVLSKGAYFNENVLSFTIEPGETTVLEVSSVIRKANTFLLKFFVPEVSVNVVANGVGFDAVPINVRGDKSIAWDDYSGPLKFVAE